MTLSIERGHFRFVVRPDWTRIHQGYPAGGPQDRFSCVMANRLMGNADDAGAIELNWPASRIHVRSSCQLMLAGASCQVSHGQGQCREWQTRMIEANTQVDIRFGATGCRAYLVTPGGFRLTNCSSTFQFNQPGSRLTSNLTRNQSSEDWAPPLGVLRVLPGPEYQSAVHRTLTFPWQVSPASNGMGVRLYGAPLNMDSFDITSSPVQDGTVQATAAGPIALLRERGTLGGYPRIATIIDCDVDRLAQLRPGQIVRFEWVDRELAQKLGEVYQAAFGEDV